jgi:hypothetical protein
MCTVIRQDLALHGFAPKHGLDKLCVADFANGALQPFAKDDAEVSNADAGKKKKKKCFGF